MQPRMAGLLSALVIAMGVCVNLWQPWTAWQARGLHPAVPTEAVIAADPIHRIGDLRSMPALLIFDDHDPTVPPETNAMAAKKALGSNCKIISFPGKAHADPRIYNPATVVNFLSGFPKDTPIVLLHGWGMKGTDWFSATNEGLSSQDRQTVSHFGLTLRNNFPCKASDFAGDAWGNDNALHSLEAFTAQDKRVILVGCSMGGALMWRYTLAHPEKVVALVGLAPVCSLEAMCHTQLGSDIVRAYGSDGE